VVSSNYSYLPLKTKYNQTYWTLTKVFVVGVLIVGGIIFINRYYAY